VNTYHKLAQLAGIINNRSMPATDAATGDKCLLGIATSDWQFIIRTRYTASIVIREVGHQLVVDDVFQRSKNNHRTSVTYWKQRNKQAHLANTDVSKWNRVIKFMTRSRDVSAFMDNQVNQ
jgi:RNA polymerase-interacting CarD/CdnL/TRCF family regulator